MKTEKIEKLCLFRVSSGIYNNFLNDQLYYQNVPDILYRRAHLQHSFYERLGNLLFHG